MTTIAYRDGIMAADSCVTASDIRRGETAKLWRLPDGGLFGYAGAAGIAPLLIPWLHVGANFETRPKLPDGCTVCALWVRPDGALAAIGSDLIPAFHRTPFAAQGSGNEIALGAMAMGASARQAVEVAARFDVYTGGEIVSFALAGLAPRGSGHD